MPQSEYAQIGSGIYLDESEFVVVGVTNRTMKLPAFVFPLLSYCNMMNCNFKCGEVCRGGIDVV